MPETNRFLRKLKANRRSKSRDLARRRLRMESLEDRRLLAAIPVLNSYPGANATLYLDFDGHFEASWGSYSNVTTPVLDFDGDPNSTNSEEDQYIRDVWAIVAEDYAPFNINVTTIEPAVFADGVPSSAANGVALRVAIGGSSAVLNRSDSALGYGFYNSFTSSVANLALVFPETASGSNRSAITIGSVASHEAGHSFGLRHFDGLSDVTRIMNSVGSLEDAFWGTGTNDLGNYQDDIVMLSSSLNGFGYRADDHAGTIAGATPLTDSETNFTGSGIIGAGGDVDMWSLNTTGTNSLRISVAGSGIGQNLDAVIDFLDAAGNVILTASPTNSYDAEMFVEATGTSYVAVRGTGEYGRIGQYTISVAASLPGVSLSSSVELKTSELGTSDSFSLSLNSKPTSDVIIEVSSSDTSEGTVSTRQLIFTPLNWYLPQTVTVFGMNDAAVDGYVQYAINLGPVSSADANYDGLAIDSMAAANADDDVPGKVFQLEGTGYVYVTDMEAATDGSLFVIGGFSDTVDFDPGPGTTTATANYLIDGFIAKYSSSQELLWVRTFGETTGLASPQSLDLDSTGNPYFVGSFSSPTLTLGSITLTSQGGSDAYAARLDENGNFVWARSWGSIDGDYAYALLIDANDRLHIGGYFYGTADFNPASGVTTKASAGDADGYVTQLDNNGNFQSVTSFGGIENDFVRELAGDTNGNVYAAGYFYGTGQFGSSTLTSAGSYDSFFAKLSSAGTIEWARQAAGVAIGSVTPKLAVTSTGDVYFSAHFTEDVNFGAGTPALTSTGDSDIFLTKWAADGSLLQTGQISGPERIRIAGLAIDAADQPVVFGYFGGTVDIDPSSQTINRTSIGAQADFILRLDANAQFLDFYQMPRDTGLARAMTLDSRGNIYASGHINTTISMPTGQQLVNAEGSYDSYILKLATALGITVGSSAGLTTSEDGDAATFTVTLDTPPTSDVTIAVGSSDATEGTVSQTLLTFTPTNWNMPQSVTVTGVDDPTIDGDVAYTIVLSPATSADLGYQGIDPADVAVTNVDNDAPLVLFTDSFEVGEWNGLWVEDSQNDWFRSSQRATSGSFAAEVDGSATNATITTANVIDLSGMASATLTFDWLIESGFDAGEYLSLDISTNGGASWTQDIRRLNGNVSVEDVWHNETVDLSSYNSSNLKIRFRSKVSASDEDANVDNVKIVGIPLGPNVTPVAAIGGLNSMTEGSSVGLSGAGSTDPDGSIANYAWDFDNDGQYDDASGVSVNFATTHSGLHTVGLQVTDNRGATAVTSTTVMVNNVAPTANAGSDINGNVGTPVNLSAAGSTDPGNDIVSYLWDLNNDGQYDDAVGVNATFSAAANGTYVVSVLVTDADGATSTDSATITLSTVTVSSTKFYVVDDGSPDQTYEYGATGSAIENYAIDSGNSRPRGAASNAAGDTVWVADRNRKVYVYDTSGGLSGSWSAGTLASTAAVEGIATNGSDVWIVDSKSDRVYRYSGAATRTSGSQSAVSSFALNSSNRSPKGIVTDGNYFWIIDSNTSDKVFKYTTSGSLIGSWTIDAANSSPTGLTIDPTGASQSIWIVDSGTDKVYEYTDALGTTSDSLSAANIFALAAGNTNPQGIADPPAPVATPATPATPAVLVVAMQLETKPSDAERDPDEYSDSLPQAFTVQKLAAFQERVVDSVISEISRPGDGVSEDSEEPGIERDAMLDLLARDLAEI